MRSRPMLHDQHPEGTVNTVIARERVFSQVHRYIRDKILRGGYPEGTRLIETSIAAELNISRTPVREALVLLGGTGLVRILENGGFVVCDVYQQLIDIIDIRVALETHAVANAVRNISNEDIAMLERLCVEMEATAPAEIDRRAELNRKFHETLVGAAHNQRLIKMIGDYQDYFRIAQPLYIDPEALRQTQAEHRGITEAIRLHDVDLAPRLVSEHIRNAGAHIIRHFKENNRLSKVDHASQASG